MPEAVSVGGRYELGDLLGRGGMAEVRRAMDTRLGRPVAVKQLRTDLAGDPTFQARFRREAQSAAGLNHPTIVAVYDTGEETDPQTGVSVPYIVMELVEGPTLRDILRDGSKIMPERALELTQGVLDALSYSHRAGIVHRDIKPANVMLTQTGNVKVMDFGIARAVADTSATMTQTAAVIGTAQYLSPEQARGETVDARSDIYSAGCLLYELLTGRPPFVGDSPVSVAYQHVRENPVPPSELNGAVTPEMDAIVLKALAKSPDERYQSARDMKADITRVLAGEQVTAIVPTAPVPDPEATRVATRVPPPAPIPVVTRETEEEPPEDEAPRKRRAWIPIVIVAVLLLALGGAYGLYRYFQPPAVAMVTMPSVTGYSEAQARSQLMNSQLSGPVTVAHTNGADDNTVNTVIRQNPTAGSNVPENSPVTITINDGPKTAQIPDDIVGKSRADAEKELTNLGFNNVEPVAVDNSDGKTNEVTQVDPGEGESVSLGTKITLSYASGKVTVPPVTGQSEQGAREQLEGAGFKVSVKREYSDTTAAGVVADQDPTGSSVAKEGSTVTIVVSRGPESTPTPTPTPTPSETPSATPSPTPSPTPS
ncbi:serine/threonine-protein kinase [Friedmanniella endophytica]|uniref:non-specific serine/threonine protein kinase n=1 Tax=Microlunatus kandeliicorticis TaxID=1759536 RepID=A0A7W3P5B4_9ACTN|nr:Stk1 family PASTA domain-containing Ser/Thr kinase [Microlunatus kandeliicorticis]MBA8793799.1 serine/threonine-protein kinase [Microlunatus kandeliicorticis]